MDLNKWSEISTLWKKSHRRWKDNENKEGSNFLFISSFIRKVWNCKFYTLKTLQGNVRKLFFIHTEEYVQLYQGYSMTSKMCIWKHRICLLYIWLLLKTKQATRVQKIRVYVLRNYFVLFGCNLDFLTKCVTKCSIQNNK